MPVVLFNVLKKDSRTYLEFTFFPRFFKDLYARFICLHSPSLPVISTFSSSGFSVEFSSPHLKL